MTPRMINHYAKAQAAGRIYWSRSHQAWVETKQAADARRKGTS